MSVYIPNVGEKEALKAIILQEALILALYKNQVIPDGNATVDTLEEMPTGGGRGYAPKVLSADLIEGAAVADKWSLGINSSGKAEAQYSNAPQLWTFQAADVADGNTVYGVFGYTLVLPFDAGAKEIKVGDTVKGATSGAVGVVAAIHVTSGTWGGSPGAAGNLYIKQKTGAFQDNESILISGEVGTLVPTPTAGGTGYAVGDLVEIVTGGKNALAVVATVDAGAVTAIYLATGGKGYTVGTGKATAKITGSGNDDLTVEIGALAATAYVETNTGAVGDALKKLIFVETLTAATLVDTLGQVIGYTPKLSMSTS